MATKKATAKKTTAKAKPAPIILVADRGWVFQGTGTEGTRLGIKGIIIDDARCVRRWGTTKGLAQLAKEGPQANTKLDDSRSVFVPAADVKSIIECDAAAWAGK